MNSITIPSETNVRMCDVAVINKIDSATPEQIAQVRASLAAVNPGAMVIEAASPDFRGPALN